MLSCFFIQSSSTECGAITVVLYCGSFHDTEPQTVYRFVKKDYCWLGWPLFTADFQSCFTWVHKTAFFFFCTHHFIFLHYKESLRVVPLLTLTGPRLGDIEVTQVICDAFVFRELDKFCLLDFAPVLGSPLCRVAILLLTGHVRPADPVFVLSLALQVSQSVAFHLPGNLSWTSMLSNPLLTRDAFPQKGQGEEHGGPLFLKRKNS